MILIIGFPKAGTTSFDYLLTELGYKTIHSHTEDHNIIVGELIEEAKNNNEPLLSYIEKYGYNAITEMNYSIYPKTYWPQFTHIKEIVKEYQDAVFILNKRDIKKHVKCLQSLSIDEIIKKDNKLDEDIENIIIKYYDNIEKIMKENNRKYIEYNIDTDDISKLQKYIDLKGISTFPHLNKSSYLTTYT
jgi:hypothetical protein